MSVQPWWQGQTINGGACHACVTYSKRGELLRVRFVGLYAQEHWGLLGPTARRHIGACTLVLHKQAKLARGTARSSLTTKRYSHVLAAPTSINQYLKATTFARIPDAKLQLRL